MSSSVPSGGTDNQPAESSARNVPNTERFLAQLHEQRLLAIVRSEDGASAVRCVLILADAGVRLIEVSLTTPDALDVIAHAVKAVPRGVQIGAGTICRPEDVDNTVAAGAEFFVTPGLNAAVSYAASKGRAVVAGALTPTEVFGAIAAGATAVKLFPASLGGPRYLKALRDPFPTIDFIPVGGIDGHAAQHYLAAGAAAVGVGSPLIGDPTANASHDGLRERAVRFLNLTSCVLHP